MGDAAAKTTEEMEAEISQAMRARISDFKKQAETLTLEGVRRALEADLHLEKFSLDDYKKFIKQRLNEYFAEADDETASKTPEKVTEEVVQPEQEKVSRQHGDLPPSKIEPTDSVSDLSEDMIRGAMKKRASHIRANIEKLSLAQVRRLLEGDLKLETKALDVYKGFISNELDDILASTEEAVEATNGVKKKQKKDFKSKELKKKAAPSKSSSRVSESMGSDDALSDDEETKEERRPKKRPSKDTEVEESTKPSKKQKKSVEGSKSTGKKKKPADLELDKSSGDEDGNSSESSHSGSSADERVKKKTEKPTQVYGKQVEHLKTIIKSCGMGITPAVYKKAKQAPENKREAVLIKELEDILRKEGLSTNPSEKEIKAVKKRKATAKELEGIDTSNIVSSSRRRAASSYIPLPKPKIDVESDDEAEDEDEDENDDEEDEDGDDGGESSEVSGQDAEYESD